VIDGAAYSVPYSAIGKAVDATAALISIFLRGRRIACHARAAAGSRTTLEAHQPASHRAVARYTPEHLQAEFAAIGSAAALLFERILAAPRAGVPVLVCSGSAALMAPTGWNRPVRPPWKPTCDPGATGSSPAARLIRRSGRARQPARTLLLPELNKDPRA
jgi:hypothetical protein